MLSRPLSEDQLARPRTLTFADALQALRRGAPFALLVTAIAVVVSFLMTQRATPVYEAQAAVVASRAASSLGELDVVVPPPVDARVYQRAINEGAIVHDALLRLDGRERGVAEVTRFLEKVRVSIEVHDLSSVVSNAVRDANPQQAATYANAIAERLMEWDRERGREMLTASVNAIERAIQDIDLQIAAAVQAEDQINAQRLQTLSATRRESLVRELEVAQARSASTPVVGLLKSLSVAQPPVEPVAPRPVFNAFVAVLLGLLLGYGVQFGRWSLDDRVRTPGGLGDATGLPVLGRLLVPRRGLRLSEEAVGLLHAGLMGVLRREGTTVIGVASATAFDEKSGVALSLADALARSGYRTLLVDLDVRRLGPGYGVDVTRFAVPLLEAYLRDPNLQFEPLGFAIDSKRSFDALLPSGSGEALAGPLEGRLAALIERLGSVYDVVVLDVPPVLSGADALAAASVCHALALCVGAQTKREDARAAAMLVERSGPETAIALMTEPGHEGTPRRPAKVDVRVVARGKGAGRAGSAVASEPTPRAYARVKPR